MKGNRIVYMALLLSMVSLILTGFTLWKSVRQKKHVYVELQRVFTEFEMSKTYNKKLESTAMARKNILDSMEVNLKATSRMLQTANIKSGPKAESFLYDRETYTEKHKQFEEDNKALQEKYNAEVTKQLNQYVKDYGEKKNYDIIYGAEGSGVLMYVKDDLNITDDLIKYVNERYKGNSK